MPRSLLVLSIGVLSTLSIQAQEANPLRLDRFGDPLPVGAVARLGTLRFHDCRCATYSPDGKYIATASAGKVAFWDLATSKQIRQLAFEKERDIVGLIFSHDGKKLAAIGWGGTSIYVWDLHTFQKQDLVQAELGSAGGNWSNAAAFSSDDKTVVAATSKALFVWDLASGKKLSEFPFAVGGNAVDVRLLSVSDDGKVVATQGRNKVHLWDTRTGTLLYEMQTSGGETMKFSRDGKSLVVSGYRHSMSIYSVETGKKIHSLQVSKGVQWLDFSSDGKTLAAASNDTIGSSSTDGDQVVQLWDFANLQAPPVKFQAQGINSVAISPDGKTLAWGCLGMLCFMDRATGKDLQPVASHRGAIKSLLYLLDGKRIISASADNTIRIWDAETSESLNVLQGHSGTIQGMALFPNGKLLASCGEDGTFRLWDVTSGKSVAVLDDERNSVLAAAFSADGKKLASGGNRGITFLRDPANGKILEEIETNSICSLAFSPDGKTLAILANHDRKLLLYDLSKKKLLELPLPKSGSSLTYSPDGKILVVGGNEYLLLFDTATNKVVRRLPGHWNSRGCVAFSPDGRYLASVSDGCHGPLANRTLRIFEVASGTEIHSFEKELPLYAAAFSPDGFKLVVGGDDATAMVLDLTNLTGKKRREKLNETELLACWKSLATTDASNAYDARIDLFRAPGNTVPFLAKQLKPAPPVDASRVASSIKALDSEDFEVREAATTELEQLGELVREPLRAALAANPPSAEARQRLSVLLGKLEQFSPAQLRNVRAIEVLERIGTSDALQIVEQLAKGNELGHLTAQSRAVLTRRQRKNLPLPEIPKPQQIALSEAVLPPGPVLLDLEGDPMPAGAIARLGATRWRLLAEPRRIVPSADGKTLAVVDEFSIVELLDAQTGKNLGRMGEGFFGFGIDMRVAVALSADCRKVASIEAGERGNSFLAVSERGKTDKVKIEYRRKNDSYPAVPDDDEGAGFSGSSCLEYVSAAEFSPDGKVLVGSVRFEWRAFAGKESKKVEESHVIGWDASTGKEVWKSPASPKTFNTIAFSPDGKTITLVDRDGVGFWDAATGKERLRWPCRDSLFSARYSPDRSWLATGSKGKILLWEVSTGTVARSLVIPGDEIQAIAFSPDGKLLVGGGEKTIRLWDVSTGKARGDCSPFPNPAQAVVFSSDGKTIFSGHERENVLRRWDAAALKPSGELTGPISPLSMLSFSPDGSEILASSKGEDFYLWEAETGKSCPLPKKDEGWYLAEFFASSARTNLLRCEEGIGMQFVMLLIGKGDQNDRIPGLLGSSIDGQRVLIKSEKDKLPGLRVVKLSKALVKDEEKRKEDILRDVEWKDDNEINAALSPDGKTVVVAGRNVVCFFDVATGAERRYEHPTRVESDRFFRTRSIKFSPDGSRIVLVGSEGNLRILAVRDGRKIAEFAKKSQRASGLAFSPDGQTLLTTSFSAPVYAWEVATGQMVRKLEPATYFYSPDNRLVAGLTAGKLRVFDLYSGRALRDCKPESGLVGDFAFSPNGKLLAASCSDTTISIWPTSAVDAKPVQTLDEKGLAEILEKGTASDAYAAIGRMIADPERAIAFLERTLRPAPNPDAREAAISAEDVLHIRAIQALERIATKRARQLLEKIAQGAEGSPRTRAAVEALRRLEGR